MNKKIAALSLAAAMAVSAAGITAIADDEPIKIIVNNDALNIPADDTQPFIENEHTLVPMRAIFEALGASVNWDDETKTVVSYDPVSDVSITLQIDSNIMFVDEEPVELETPARIVNDRTVVPVRAIAEGMNSEVVWDGETRTVIITKDLTPKAAEEPEATDEPAAADEPTAQIANPWTEYATLDELNAALNEAEGVKYQVADPASIVLVPIEGGYRYLADENLAEQSYAYNVGSSALITIRTITGAVDASVASGYQQFDKVEEYTLENGSAVTVYKYEKTIFAVWTDADEVKAGNEINHSVAVTSDDDLTEVLKQLVEDVDTNYPKG